MTKERRLPDGSSALTMTTMSRFVRLVPWLLALVGLGVPSFLAGEIAWLYVGPWLILLAVLWFVRPLAGASHRIRIQSALACVVLLMWPGWIIGGLYLIPAALAWLALELLAPLNTVAAA
jgi:hypothetical protein